MGFSIISNVIFFEQIAHGYLIAWLIVCDLNVKFTYYPNDLAN